MTREEVDYGGQHPKSKRVMTMALIISPHALAKGRTVIQLPIEDDENWTKPAVPLWERQEIQKVLRRRS
jgi:hypothetical protein